jgi:hypothetical protein
MATTTVRTVRTSRTSAPYKVDPLPRGFVRHEHRVHISASEPSLRSQHPTSLDPHDQNQNIYLDRLHSYQCRYEAAMKSGHSSLIARIRKQLDRYTELAAACWARNLETVA